MIFVTVGAQMPFDRLIRAVDAWAGSRGRDDLFAQIGESEYRPMHLEFSCFMDPDEFEQRLETASAIVAHAGMGSIITALERAKPILVMPRRSDLGETRNDHQVATARQFAALELVEVAMDEHTLPIKLDQIVRLRAGASGGRSPAQCVTCPFAGHPEACSAAGTEACAGRHAYAACPHLLSAVRAFAAEDEFAINRYAIAPDAPVLS